MCGFNDELLDSLPDEFWDYYTLRSPNSHGEYHNLFWQEWQAIKVYIDLNDQSLINKIIGNEKYSQSEGFRRFLIDKNDGKLKRPKRTKKTTIHRDREIYEKIQLQIKKQKDKTLTNIVMTFAEQMHLSDGAIYTAYYRGKTAKEKLEDNFKRDVMEQYQKYQAIYSEKQ